MRRCGGHQSAEASTPCQRGLPVISAALSRRPAWTGMPYAAGWRRSQRVMPDSQAVNRPDGFSAMTIWLLSLPKRLRTLLAVIEVFPARTNLANVT